MLRRLVCVFGLFLLCGFFLIQWHSEVIGRMLIVDRIEEDLVVVEWERGHFKVPKDLFKVPVREGDVLAISIDVDRGATEDRRKKVREKMQFDEY
ncbi:MAG TPA: DUF3006 domain-containing protein [Bacillota bacterium]|nr:DUF3006 domain-containing protein [Bacillota bacterium]HPZ73181.1 DUF3006 domain-containing protein [Bacillota bacterium]HQD77991.1 DUF3006 domain-containing protein [Bacillota bacterium]